MSAEIFPKLGNARIDEGNSSVAALGISAVFTGTSVDVSEYIAVQLQVFSDEDSATLGVSVETSVDGTNWDHSHDYDYVAGGESHYDFALPAKYYRVVYTNGVTGQGVFRLQAKLLKVTGQDHAHPIDTSLTIKHPAKIVRSVITGEDIGGGGILVNAKVDPTTGGLLTLSSAFNPVADDLLCNANIQVGDADVSESNPVPQKTKTSIYTTLDEIVTPTAAILAGEHVYKGELAGAMTENNGEGIFQSLSMIHRNSFRPELELTFYSQDITMISAVNAVQEVTLADMDYSLFTVYIRVGSWSLVSGGSNTCYVATLPQLSIPVKATNSQDGIFYTVKMGTDETFTTTSALAIVPKILRS